MCTPVAPPLGPADFAHLNFRSTELSSSQRQKEQLYSHALWGATSGWFAACGSRLSSFGLIYDIVHAAGRDGRALGELAFKPRRDLRMSRSDLRGPIHPSGRGTAHGDRLVVWGLPGHQNRVFRCRFEGLRGSQVSSRVRSDRRSDAVRRLTCMMIQAHVTSDSSLLRASLRE